MPKQTFEWGRQSFGVPAQVVGVAVERITKREGACPPQRLVQEAQKEDSPLHKLFTWDNASAADRWRKHEARLVINSIVIRVKDGDKEIVAPAFVSVGHVLANQDRGEGYRPVGVVAADEAFADEMMREALSRLQAIRARYAALSALTPVWVALDEVAS